TPRARGQGLERRGIVEGGNQEPLERAPPGTLDVRDGAGPVRGQRAVVVEQADPAHRDAPLLVDHASWIACFRGGDLTAAGKVGRQGAGDDRGAGRRLRSFLLPQAERGLVKRDRVVAQPSQRGFASHRRNGARDQIARGRGLGGGGGGSGGGGGGARGSLCESREQNQRNDQRTHDSSVVSYLPDDRRAPGHARPTRNYPA